MLFRINVNAVSYNRTAAKWSVKFKKKRRRWYDCGFSIANSSD